MNVAAVVLSAARFFGNILLCMRHADPNFTMGFFLSILYFITYYLTPETIFGPMAAYRIELILAALVTVVSLPKLSKSFIWKTPQTLALLGLGVAMVLSGYFGMHWGTGGIIASLGLIPSLLGYFLVCLHCDSKNKLQIVAIMLLFVCVFVTAHGYVELQNAPPPSDSAGPGDVGSDYLMPFGTFYRLRGLGMINDPNDFAQVIACTLPLMFLFWKPKKTLQNIGFVILPVCVLLYGAYLTHSRGAMLAILVMAIVAARRRIGTVPALLLAGLLYAVAMDLNFTGGRGVSASAGEDRTALWAGCMELLKSHPLFGVGYGTLPDYLGLTAHNSVMVCVTELGLVGFYFWCLFLYPTVRDALSIAKKVEIPTMTAAAGQTLISRPEEVTEKSEAAETKRMGHLMVLSLTGFFVSAWFLSRAYVLTLFILGGMTEVVYETAVRQGRVVPRLPLGRVLGYAGALAISLIVLMYLLLRIANLIR